MKLAELTNQLPHLKEEKTSVYNDLVAFTEFMINKGHSIHSVDFSGKSCSTYVMFSLKTEDGDLYCVRFSDHRPNGNHGCTDLNYFDNCTLEENYEEVEIFIEENDLELA